MHQATRGNNKILRTPPPHISSSEEILPRLTRRTLAQLRTNKSPIILTQIRRQITSITTMPPLQHPPTWHTPSLQLHPHTHHTVTPGFVDRPCWSDGAAGQISWLVDQSGMIGLPHKQGSREWVDNNSDGDSLEPCGTPRVDFPRRWLYSSKTSLDLSTSQITGEPSRRGRRELRSVDLW